MKEYIIIVEDLNKDRIIAITCKDLIKEKFNDVYWIDGIRMEFDCFTHYYEKEKL